MRTPGQWSTSGVRVRINGDEFLQVLGPKGVVAYVPYDGRSNAAHVEAMSDQRIIAASPNLFDSLKAIVDCWGIACSSNKFVQHLRDGGFIDDARTAIQKAEWTAAKRMDLESGPNITAEDRSSRLIHFVRLMHLNIKNDAFIDPLKRAAYIGMIEAAIAEFEGNSDSEVKPMGGG